MSFVEVVFHQVPSHASDCECGVGIIIVKVIVFDVVRGRVALSSDMSDLMGIQERERTHCGKLASR